MTALVLKRTLRKIQFSTTVDSLEVLKGVNCFKLKAGRFKRGIRVDRWVATENVEVLGIRERGRQKFLITPSAGFDKLAVQTTESDEMVLATIRGVTEAGLGR